VRLTPGNAPAKFATHLFFSNANRAAARKALLAGVWQNTGQ